MDNRKSAKRQRLQNETRQKLMDKSNAMNINDLPDEVLVGIFSLLTHNELALIAQNELSPNDFRVKYADLNLRYIEHKIGFPRVCRKWKELTRSSVLWRIVDVCFDPRHESKDVVLRKLMNSLSPCTSRIKLDFGWITRWSVPLNFEDLSSELQGICPNLEVLIFRMAFFSCSFSSFIRLCAKFLPNIRVLSFQECGFNDLAAEVDCDGVSKVEVLDFGSCVIFHKTLHLKMPFLKEFRFPVCLGGVSYWFDGDVSYLRHLETLNLRYVDITTDLFRIIQNTALNLVELYLCIMSMDEEAFDFNRSTNVFPNLKVICLMENEGASSENVLSLIRSCRSLQKIYLDKEVLNDALQSFACKRKIEIICGGHCGHDAQRDYLHK